MADLYKGHFGWSQTPEARNFARLQGVRIVFPTAKFAKNFISGLKMEKKVLKIRKAIVLNRIYAEIVV
jgi:hypothetical protein